MSKFWFLSKKLLAALPESSLDRFCRCLEVTQETRFSTFVSEARPVLSLLRVPLTVVMY